jgi:hypothetical protein
MKKSITFLSLSIMLGSCAFAFAQGKGQGLGHGPSVGQGHGQIGGQGHSKTTSSNQGTPSTGSSSDKQTKPTWETKFTERLQSDPAFQTRIKNLLGDIDPATAMDGFKNRGQFMAAMHVSQNLHIPFDQLKAKMTGVTTTTAADGTTQTTKTDPMSLGKAIQELRPTLTPTQVNVEVQKAEAQATTTEKTSPTS